MQYRNRHNSGDEISRFSELLKWETCPIWVGNYRACTLFEVEYRHGKSDSATRVGLWIHVGALPLCCRTTGEKGSLPLCELHQVKALLNLADRDYKGHRAAAVTEITTAIHALQSGYAHPKLPKTVQKGGGEAQALSDNQLNEAITQLQTIQMQLKGTPGAAVVTANTAIDTAIAELKIALTIK
jgi:hypothetical protein